MKAISLFFFNFLFLISTFAGTFKVIGAQGELIFSQKFSLQVPRTVGQVTIEIFQKNQIPHKGSDEGILQIFGLEQEIQVISESAIKAYGWCYSVDGKLSEFMPDQAQLSPETRELLWFYGYAYYQNGEWVGQCERD